MILVHKLATGTLLTQSPQPMLAHGPGMRAIGNRLGWLEILRRGGDVSQRASRAEWAMTSGGERVAEGRVGVELERERVLDEGFDLEFCMPEIWA